MEKTILTNELGEVVKSILVIETNKEYHSNTLSISKSKLANMGKSPEYFKWILDNPQEPTNDLIIGQAFHKITLEPNTFYDEFAVMPACDRRTNAGKETYARFTEENISKTIITEDVYNTICGMRDSVMANKYACALLSNGNTEQSIYWTDTLTGETCKCRPDYYRTIEDRILITDLKSCRQADSLSLSKDVVKYGYDLQAGMYSTGLSTHFEKSLDLIDFVFIFVEKEPPYLINVTQASRFVIDRGISLFREYLGMYAECKRTNNWYGYNGETGAPNDLLLPSYLIQKQ